MLQPLADQLEQSGWPAERVAIVAFDDPFGSNILHATEIARAVEALERASGADRVAIVAHSMGGLATRYYLAHQPSPRICAALFLATPHLGTWVAWLAPGAGGREMRPGSRFLRDLTAAPAPADVRLVCFRAPADTRLLPARSAWLDGAECRTLPTAGHKRILGASAVHAEVAAILSGL